MFALRITAISTFAAVAILSGLAVAQNKDKEKKPAEALLIKETAEQVARDFKDDPKKARGKYTPKKPPKGVLAGTIVIVTGEVEKIEGSSVHLKTGSDIAVVFRAKKRVEKKDKHAEAEVRSVSFKGKQVVFEVDEVKFREKDKE